jgi:hypothetical protein
VSGLSGPQARELHIVSVVSRSGRASREIARVDIDELDKDLPTVASDIADMVYSRHGDAERHAPLSEAILEAITVVERIPGHPAIGEALLPDGRIARVERILSF